jgi:hypothetical protein
VQQCACNENIWHVVDVNQVIPVPHLARRKYERGSQDKRRILIDVRCLAGASASDGDANDVYSVGLLMPGSPAVCQTYVINAHALTGERLSGATRP